MKPDPHCPTTGVLSGWMKQGHLVPLLTELRAELAEPGVLLAVAQLHPAPKAAWLTVPPKSICSHPRPTLTCICEMASSILKRVCRMQEQDDWDTVTHCRSHRISSHMHDTCSTPKGCHHRPPLPAAGSHRRALGKSICLSV